VDQLNEANESLARDSTRQSLFARQEHTALALTAGAAVATVVWLMSPVAVGMLLGVVLAFMFESTHARIARHLKDPAAALTTVLASTLAMALVFGGTGWLLVDGAATLSRNKAWVDDASDTAKKLAASAGHWTNQVGVSPEELAAKIRGAGEAALSRAGSFAQIVTASTAMAALGLFFAMLTMYFVLRRGQPIATELAELLPLRPEYTRRLLTEFRLVGRGTLLGIVVSNLLQGVLATFGYLIVGLPQPLFFGALTAVVSLVPGIGNVLVWIAASIVLFVGGRIAAGIVLGAWGIVALTIVPNYIVLPRFLRHGTQIPALFSFVALLGGTALFGLKGILLGPILMTTAIAVLRIYAAEQRTRRHPSPSNQPTTEGAGREA
jgi:predicted PurR-regulated permease PerM